MSAFQRFEVKTINRSDVALAEYNPRVITDHAKKELKRKIKKVGLLEPLIWNKRTGKLVSGHQRITQLDALEGYPGKTYELVVSVVDLDDKTEREMNVFLNNPSAQGEFDLDALRVLFDEGSVDIGEIGFEDSDIQVLFEDFDPIEAMKEAAAPSEATGALEDIKKARDAMRDSLKKKDEGDFYFIVVCRDMEEKQKLLVAFSSSDATQQFVRSSCVIAALADHTDFL